MSKQNNPEQQLGYYFLRISAERFAADLSEFSKEIRNFSNEQLFGIASYSDLIQVRIADIRKELERRVSK